MQLCVMKMMKPALVVVRGAIFISILLLYLSAALLRWDADTVVVDHPCQKGVCGQATRCTDRGYRLARPRQAGERIILHF